MSHHPTEGLAVGLPPLQVGQARATLGTAYRLLPGWLGAIAEWNPVSATAAAARELFGNPTGAGDGPLAEHAVLLALAWPAVLTAVFLPLAARAYRNLSR